jgi:hypothetical protein
MTVLPIEFSVDIIRESTACTNMIGAVWSGHNGHVSHMERNSRYSSFHRMRNPTPPSHSLGLWRYKETMATPEQKAFCVLQFAKHESVVSVQRAFRRQFQSDPPSANSFRRWYQQLQTTGCLCKGKSAGRPRVWNEWDSLFFAVKRNLCAMRVVNWRCRLWLCGGVAKETRDKALSSSLCAVSSIILVCGVFEAGIAQAV